MEWFKVKTKHLSTDYSDADLGALIRFQGLVASLERMPTESEIRQVITETRLKRLQVILKTHQVCIQVIAEKVLEDVQDVAEMRLKGKLKKRKQRDLDKMSRGTRSDLSRDREEKIREEKNPLTPKSIIETYNANRGDLPACTKLTPAREKGLKARIKEKEYSTLEFWHSYFNKANKLQFLLGKNDREWKADFEWLINPNNIAKVLEGKYDGFNKEHKSPANDPNHFNYAPDFN